MEKAKERKKTEEVVRVKEVKKTEKIRRKHEE
jgi:hypothetical protein